MKKFDIDLYAAYDMERWISSVYQQHGINNPNEMDIEHITDIFEFGIADTRGGSKAVFDPSGDCLLFLNSQLNEQQRRADFFHELCHPVMHCGNQRKLPDMFVEKQEFQADVFQLYSAMPYYLIQALPLCETDNETIGLWSEEFKLPHSLVGARLEQIKRRINSIVNKQPNNNKILDDTPMFPPSQYSKETNDLIMKAFKLNEYRRFEVQLVWR